MFKLKNKVLYDLAIVYFILHFSLETGSHYTALDGLELTEI